MAGEARLAFEVGFAHRIVGAAQRVLEMAGEHLAVVERHGQLVRARRWRTFLHRSLG